MQQIADWLKMLGLAQYAQRFAENDINFAILSDLSDQDLKELGVSSLGHRRQLLGAIAEISRAEQDTPATAATASVAQQTHDAAERRQVTVMFSDLVGSTALSAHMDPEDLREIISAYQKCVAETVVRFGGFVAKYMGDGVLVYFGYPQAHEDDAERAVRAGLGLIAAVTALKLPVSLQTRVGIATGLVVVGDLSGSGEAQERGIVGETPNLAARLQAMAEPNTVVIAESTRQLLGNLFELEDLGAKNLKGIARPARAWAAIRASSVESRFEAMHSTGLTALVGREEELELLVRRWSRAKTGEGQVVLLSGEGGIGKSRLTAALLEHLATEPHTRLRYFCSPQHTDSAFYPIIGQMERAAGLAHGDTPQARLDKLDAVLAQTSTSLEDAALFAEMLSLPNDGRYPALALSPVQRRQRTLEALTSQVAGLASQQPVLMIFEDAHWTDPTSLEAFGRAVDRVKTLPVLLIVTFRPEFNPPWVGQSGVTSATLNRLGEREAAAIIARLVGNKELPADVMAEIVERTDGIPLFVEEMTKAVLEAGSEGEARRTAATVPSAALAVPASLHASLMARLDRLGPAKAMMQLAAALGREFSYELLSAVAPSDDAKLLAVLNQLVAAGLLFCYGTPPHATYLFKHALIQDAAYGTLLREARRDLHARIASTLHDNFPQIRDTQPEILAHHYFEAGQLGAAIKWRAKAGNRALRRSAFVEAIQQFKNGLNLLDVLPEGIERAKREIELQTGLGVALTANKGYAAHETGKAYTRARQLCEEVGDTTALVRVGYGQYLYHLMAGEVRQSHQLATETLELAERIDNDDARVLGHRTLGVSLFELGQLAEARRELEAAAELFDLRKKQRQSALASETRIMISTWLSYLLVFQGYFNDAIQAREIAWTEANASSALHTRAFSLGFGAALSYQIGDHQDFLNRAHALHALASEQALHFHKTIGLMYLGWCRMKLGDIDARSVFQEGLDGYRNSGSRWALPMWLGGFSALLPDNDEQRVTILDQAFEAVESTQEQWYAAELHRLRGDFARTGRCPNDDLAEENYSTARRIAQEQGSMLLNLRASTSLALLFRDQGKIVEASDLLGPVYGWFTQGFNAPVLRRAKALLDKLS